MGVKTRHIHETMFGKRSNTANTDLLLARFWKIPPVLDGAENPTWP
jgi:hypothetical protein